LTVGKRQLGVIFDMDGVLVDSYKTHFESWRALAEERALRMVGEEEFASFFGRTNRDIIPEIWGTDLSAGTISELDARKEVLYRALLERDFPAMDGARELIDDLRDAGFLLAVGSSGPPENIEQTLRGLGRASAFSAVVTKEDVKRGKPDPQVFLLAAERMGLEPSRCAVVEDAPVGVSAALSGGMTAIGLIGTARADELGRGHLVVESLRELTPDRIADLIQSVTMDSPEGR
jgi:beta-phosphoglucomutase